MTARTRNTDAPAELNDVCDYIILKMSEAEANLNVLKLHKLLYYVQAWHLAFGRGRCFNHAFQAWVHGPVCRATYDRFKDAKSMYSPIRRRDMRDDFEVGDLPRPVKRHVDSILEAYADFTDDQLEEMTHRERPWAAAREGVDPKDRSEKIISDELMAEFYRARLKRNESK
jgi:uncharacterized phage-associated protein